MRWSRQIGEELNSLPSSLDKELVQLIDYYLDGSDQVLQLVSATQQLSQVGAIISFDDHRLFPRIMLRSLFRTVVIQVWLIALLLDGIGEWWWQVEMLSARPGSPCQFG